MTPGQIARSAARKKAETAEAQAAAYDRMAARQREIAQGYRDQLSGKAP